MLKPKLIPLQCIKTEEGELFPIYKDWDPVHDSYSPKMVYATTILPGVAKGPILHRRRKGFITCLSGNIVIECLVDKKIEKYSILNNDGTRNILIIPENTPNLIRNISNKETAILMNLPSKSWHPEDEDTEKFKSWKDFLDEQD